MNVVKLMMAIASLIVVALLAIIIFVKKPTNILFEKAITTVMLHENFTSQEEVIHQYPVFEEMKSKMNRIAYLRSSMHAITSGPVPMVSKAERLQLQYCTDEIHRLQKNITSTLQHFITNYQH